MVFNILNSTLIIINILINAYIIKLLIDLGNSRIEHVLPTSVMRKERDYTLYDERMAAYAEELKMFNNASNGGILAEGVYNIEHKEISIESELYPSIEEEKQIGYNEVSK